MEHRLIIILFIAFGMIFGGVIGYRLIEGWSFLDSLYMTIITISTVGFQEVYPLSRLGRIFTISLIITGVFVVTLTISYIVSLLAEGRFGQFMKRREMKMDLKKIENHYIICGCGTVGGEILTEFIKAGERMVVIEESHEALNEILRVYPDTIYVEGDATREDILREAGIERARALLAAVDNDEENVYIILTSRYLNPHLRIVSRAIVPEAIEIMKRAGANYVICPQKIGAVRMAAAALRPQVTSFLDVIMKSETLDLTHDEVEVQPNSIMVQKKLKELDLPKKIGLIIVAIKPRESAIFSFNPSADTEINEFDTIIALGRVQQFAELRQLALARTDSSTFKIDRNYLK